VPWSTPARAQRYSPSMSVLGGLFLIAHGLVHLAVWLPEPKDAPFDPGHSWLLGEGYDR
jgi:hypothetical protein